ncbi:unnamed protein product [Adineta steineri]|uniref:F-box domain-containing protein n=1 Tax=Adineta steineri TaxID=433720 RepID=A0A815FJQ9_9BILA|nr:unnamed protein product [Adineta steineri]CAF3653369.1 unnamed protein product [Adineta steineri]
MNCLEDLPDEILIEICRYLNPIDILYGFGNLNKRLECTINEFRSQLDLSLLSLNEFQRFNCRIFLNFICKYLINLTLNNECSPGQIKLFEDLIEDKCFKDQLPFLKSLKLLQFTNDNLNILSKLFYIEQLYIEFSIYDKLTKQDENLINYYLFNLSNNIEKLTLHYDEGIHILNENKINKKLKELTIQLVSLEDFLILSRIVPCLIHLEVDIVSNSSLISIPQDNFLTNLKVLYFHTRDKVEISFEQILKPLICQIPSIEYLSFGLTTNHPDYSNGILWYDFVSSMPNLKKFILGLEINITVNLLEYLNIFTVDEIKQTVFNLFNENFPLFPVSIYTNNGTLFIDSVPYQFSHNQSYNTSPQAIHSINTDITITQQTPKHILGLSINGEHAPTIINDYLNLIKRFSNITWLCLESINIANDDSSLPISFKLKYLKSLMYMRSTLCQINQTLFNKLFYGHTRLDNLKIMYGDLIYLLKNSSPPINGNHIKNLTLYCFGVDGIIRLIHLNYLVVTFPFLQHLTIHVTSSKLIKKNQIEIINQIILSFKHLRSFQMNSRRGHLQFLNNIIKDEQIEFKWLTYINATNSHLILKPKYFAIWIK